ncbi:alpha-1,2 galactosyltransferase [Microthyrium microscopicum]|uniref:Alpha-1,2 galactosyltransferase n=1 Tax=Microthyrium microscopicum TaxID=703497 RepID=A0A6A6TVI2_9PEZI|nr:alpha-1,2 galactosyltransferase [Microthyrium microscopicum]
MPSGALPPKKASPYVANVNRNKARQMSPRSVVLGALGVIGTLWMLFRLFGSSSTPKSAPKSVPGMGGSAYAKTVIVTVLDEKADADGPIADFVKQNRIDYAKKHGYATFFPSANNYTIKHGSSSWAKVPALRHAMTLFPEATYFFNLDPHTLIMNPTLSIETHILAKQRLESLMVTDVPIVPPDSVIKTFAGLKGDRVDFVITQDREGLSEKSFIIRNGDWAHFFLDAWFDPLYRTYNFQRAERHALEHIVQWHGTILAKLALVPQNIMNSYHEKQATAANDNGIYKPGDFIVNFGDCNQKAKGRNCENEMRPYYARSVQADL